MTYQSKGIYNNWILFIYLVSFSFINTSHYKLDSWNWPVFQMSSYPRLQAVVRTMLRHFYGRRLSASSLIDIDEREQAWIAYERCSRFDCYNAMIISLLEHLLRWFLFSAICVESAGVHRTEVDLHLIPLSGVAYSRWRLIECLLTACLSRLPNWMERFWGNGSIVGVCGLTSSALTLDFQLYQLNVKAWNH